MFLLLLLAASATAQNTTEPTVTNSTTETPDPTAPGPNTTTETPTTTTTLEPNTTTEGSNETTTTTTTTTTPITPGGNETMLPTTTTTTEDFCPAGWVDMGPQGCYLFMSESAGALSWLDADQMCEVEGGFLAEPRTPQQFHFLASLVFMMMQNTDVRNWWVGMSDLSHEGRWTWQRSGAEQEVVAAEWGEGSPDPEPLNTRDCAALVALNEAANVLDRQTIERLQTVESLDKMKSEDIRAIILKLRSSTTALYRDMECSGMNLSGPAAPVCQKGGEITTTTTTTTTTTGPLEIELRGGNSSCGNVFARNRNGLLAAVCDDRWCRMEARVVCRQLGFQDGVHTRNSEFGQFREFAMDDVDCEGTEDRIQDCTYRTRHNCGPGEVAGVYCN